MRTLRFWVLKIDRWERHHTLASRLVSVPILAVLGLQFFVGLLAMALLSEDGTLAGTWALVIGRMLAKFAPTLPVPASAYTGSLIGFVVAAITFVFCWVVVVNAYAINEPVKKHRSADIAKTGDAHVPIATSGVGISER